jgi:hypothetical protein
VARAHPGVWRRRPDRGRLGGGFSPTTRKKGAGGLGAEVAAELWEVDEGLRFLELSMRVSVDQDPAGVQRLEKAVRDRGLRIAAKQQTKTSTVLEHRGRLGLARGAVRAPLPCNATPDRPRAAGEDDGRL